MMRIPYKVYHLIYVIKLSCTCGKEEEKKTKINKVRYKKSEKRK
jgi:hypothetical protein